MKSIIGFATQFYTLWDYEAQPKYVTDSYGNHHCSGIDHKYYYIKNISTDLNKVKELYPDVSIDDELRGKTRSFSSYQKSNLPENYFWGGKYYGKLVDEVIESDFNYCLWSADNYSGETSEYIKNHPKYIAHFEAIEKEKQDIINGSELLKVGDIVELEFTRNGYNADDNYTECWTEAIFGDVELAVNCNGVNLVSGTYPYLMPVINGKAQKTKGKKIRITVTEVLETNIYQGVVKQFIKVA